MRIGISASAYIGRYGFEEGLQRLKKHGYSCVDFQYFADTNDELFSLDANAFEKYLNDYGNRCRAEGIDIEQTHGPWRWPPQDYTEEQRAERLEKMIRSIEGTRMLGCDNFVIHPIMPFGDHDNPHPDEFYKMNFEFMNKLCDAAEKVDVNVCLENMPMAVLTLATPAQILNFVKDINRPNMKVCLDTGHCAVCGVKPSDAVRLLGKDYLKVLHVHDNDGRSDFHWLPYFGVIDWDGFAKALKEIDYGGSVTLETAVSGKIPVEAREDMETALAKVAMKIGGLL